METFETVEEMMNHLQAVRKEARESLKDSQFKPKDFQEGVYFVNWTSYEKYGFFIFGEVVVPQPPEDGSDEDAQAEYEDEVEYDQESRAGGFIFGRCFSQACPRGELGSIHVTRLAPISKETFDRAKANGWRHLNPSN